MWKFVVIAILLCIIILIIYLLTHPKRMEPIAVPVVPARQEPRQAQQEPMPFIIVGDDVMNVLQNELLNIVLRNRERPVRRRRQDEPVDEFLRNMEVHDNDSQNVHQAEINKLFVKKYNRLAELFDVAIDDELREQAIGEIVFAAEKYINSDQKISKSQKKVRCKRINMVINKIREANRLTSISINKPPREDDILTLVWLRIQSTSNTANTANTANTEVEAEAEISLFDNLLDCAPKRKHNLFEEQTDDPISQKYSVVCINGRVGRILGSLTLIDKDAVLGAAEKDINTITNEAYAKAGHVFDTAFANYKNANPDIRKAQEIYNSEAQNNAETAELTLFENHIKNSIRDIITQDYSDILTPQKLSEIISSSQSVV
jgi:hypothetical protein